MQATLSRTDLPAVFELHNADLSGSSVRGSTPIARDPTSGQLGFAVARADAPLAGHEHLQGAFDGYDLDACARASRAGYMDAAMGLGMAVGAGDDYRRGYYSYRHDDGQRFDAETATQELRRQMHADGLLPERRQTIQSNAHLIAMPGWEAAIWLAVAFVVGRGFENILAGLRALVGAA